MKLKILSSSNVRRVTTMKQAIAAVKEAYIQLSTRKAEMPLRTLVPVQKREEVTLFMPAYLTKSDALGAKIVSVFPGNLNRSLPTIHSVMIILDAATGQPVTVMNGAYLTALRTGAASGVATELMARTDARAAAIMGAGVQARTQLEAVCTATTSSKPVFNDSDLKPGVHINGVGAYTPEMQEIPPQTVVRSKVVVDSLSASLAEAGDLILPLRQGLITEAHLHGEIGEVAEGRLPGRESEDEVTFFKSVGLAVQDVVVAELVRHSAEKLGLGVDVEI